MTRLSEEHGDAGQVRIASRQSESGVTLLPSRCCRSQSITITRSRVSPRCRKRCFPESLRFISVREIPSCFCRLILGENLLMLAGGGVISSTSSALKRGKGGGTPRRFLPRQRLCQWCLTLSLTSPDSAPLP